MLPPRLHWLLLTSTLALGLTATSSGQLISVLGNNVAISPSDFSPSTADHTDFGGVNVTAGAIDRTFTIRNTATAPLLLGVPQRIGGEAAEFTVLPPGPALSLPANTQTTFTIRFNPAGQGIRSTTVRILNNSSNASPFEFAIRGEGTIPQPEINLQGNGLNIGNGDPFPRPADHTDFGMVDIKDPPLEHTFTIQNLGDANLTIESISFFGGNSTAFSFASAPAFTLPPLTQTTFQVAFAPTTTGPHTRTIRIANNDLNEDPYEFTIQGTGTAVAPVMHLLGRDLPIAAGDTTPSAADNTKFAGTGLNDGSRVHSFTIANSGVADLTISSIASTGGNASEFTIPAYPAAPIPPQGTATFDVHFNPSSRGLRNTTLRITSNDLTHPNYDVALRGIGGVFELLGVERAGFDAIVHFHTNPDTTIGPYRYTIHWGATLADMREVATLSSPGGTTEHYRHAGGGILKTGFWVVKESLQP